jgi:two-component system, NtrC family, response regulator HydG
MRARVLIVDDDEVYLEGMKELLEESGYMVDLASSFDDGKQRLREHSPDLLIIDVRLGAFNGLQLISTGRVRIPAIVVTGFDDSVLRADADGFGASYVVKPIKPSALLALIQQKLSINGHESAAMPTEMIEQHAEMFRAQVVRDPD